MVAELRQVAAEDPSFPAILFVFQGSLAQGQAFFAEYWPEARAIADPRRRLYAAFGINRGSVSQVFGIGSIRASAQALKEGHAPGVPVGDAWLMPGMFLINAGEIVWQHKFRHIGDHPDFRQIKAVTDGLIVPA